MGLRIRSILCVEIMSIYLQCSNCGKEMRAPVELGGKLGQCPRCGITLQIPNADEPSNSNDHGALDSIDYDLDRNYSCPEPPPISTTPIPRYDPAIGGPSSPLDIELWNTDSLPHSTRVVGIDSIEPAKRLWHQADDMGDRFGLPWENRASPSQAWATAVLVLFNPIVAFSQMKRHGSLRPPIGFLVSGLAFGSFAWALQAVLGLLLWTRPPAKSDIPIELPYQMSFESGSAAALAVVWYLVAFFAGTAVLSIVSVLVQSVLLHLTLLMAGGVQGSLNVTFRVVCYAVGSLATLAVVPCLFLPAALVAWYFVIPVGLAQAHDTSGMKAFFAILPFVCWPIILILALATLQ